MAGACGQNWFLQRLGSCDQSRGPSPALRSQDLKHGFRSVPSEAGDGGCSHPLSVDRSVGYLVDITECIVRDSEPGIGKGNVKS